MSLVDRQRAPRGSNAAARRESGPTERPVSPSPSPFTGQGRKPGWDGPTYYGRAQLKPAPFDNWVVGGYIAVAGTAGSAALISAMAALAGGGRRFADLVRRARYLAPLAPLIGAPLLIWDLHTPKRFYNMLRVAKPTSPMSIGTWILSAFTAAAFPMAAAQYLADRFPRVAWLRRAADAAHAPAAVAGAGLSVYTASLLSATSAPTWAAAPRAMAVRFGASSMASGAAALLLGERDPHTRRTLEAVCAGALAVEFAASRVQEHAYETAGVAEAMDGTWGRTEKIVATGLGVLAPLALIGASLALGRGRGRTLADAAAVLTIAGAGLTRVAVMSVGDESASRPEISFRFSQPENLPGARRKRR